MSEAQIDTPLGSFWVHDDYMKKLLVHPYEVEVGHYICELVQLGMTVANIGANIGYFTRLLSECVGEGGVVHAVEPHPENVRLLRKNVGSNVVIHPVAAALESGTRTLYEHPINSGEHSLLPLSIATTSVEVEAVRMEELLPPLDFVLIDAQAFDLEIMVGLGSKRPPTAIVEYWAEGSDALGLTKDRTFEMYRRMGYQIEVMHDDVNILLTTP